MSRSRRPRRTLGIAVGVLLLAAAAGGGVYVARSMATPDAGVGAAAGTTATPTQPSPKIDVDGSVVTPSATPTFVATDPPSTVTAPPPSAATQHKVEVIQTYAGFDQGTGVSAGGYVAQTLELGGTCTLTLSRGSATVTATSQATPDASSTSCGSLTVAAGKLSSGTWSSVISYSSPTSVGTSSPQQVTVP